MRTTPPTAEATAGAVTGVAAIFPVLPPTAVKRHCSSYSAVTLVQHDNAEHPHEQDGEAETLEVSLGDGGADTDCDGVADSEDVAVSGIDADRVDVGDLDTDDDMLYVGVRERVRESVIDGVTLTVGVTEGDRDREDVRDMVAVRDTLADVECVCVTVAVTDVDPVAVEVTDTE